MNFAEKENPNVSLTSILKALRKPATGEKTAAELHADLAQIDIASLEAEVEALEARRRSLLLSGSDAEVEAATKSLASARLAVERAQAAAEEIGRLISAAQAREAAAAVDAQHEAAVAASDRIAKTEGQIDILAGQLVAMLEAAEADATIVAQWNDVILRGQDADANGRPRLHTVNAATKRDTLVGQLRQLRLGEARTRVRWT